MSVANAQAGQMMRVVVTVLNVISSIINFPTAFIAARALWFGLRGIAYYGYGVVIWGLALTMVFLILPAVCVVASTKLARKGSRWAILVALVPVALVAATVVTLLNVETDD